MGVSKDTIHYQCTLATTGTNDDGSQWLMETQCWVPEDLAITNKLVRIDKEPEIWQVTEVYKNQGRTKEALLEHERVARKWREHTDV